VFVIKKKLLYLLEKYLSGESIDYHKVIAIIIPIFVDQAFIVFINFFNTAMISSAGVEAVSAVNIVDSINMFLLNVFIAVATGGTVIVAQYKGNGDEKMVSRSAAGAIAATTFLAILIGGLIIIFHNAVLSFLFGKAEKAVFDNARIFLIGSCISYPAFAVFQASTSALRGVSDTKSSLMLSMITNFSYFLFNLLFINFLHMGVLGMAVSAILSRSLGMICSIIYIVRFGHTLNIHLADIFKVDFLVQKRMFLIGLPFAAEQMFFNGGKLLTQTFIVEIGTLALTVNAICSSLSGFMQIGGGSMSLAVITVVGQCMGRHNVKDARKFVKSFIALGSISLVIGDLLVLPFFPLLIKMFSPPQEIVGTIFFIMVAMGIASPLLWSISFICPSALRAAGDANFTSIVSMLSMWLFRVVLGYILGIVLGFGIIGVWFAMMLEWGIRGTVFVLRFKGDKWTAHNLIGEEQKSS